MKLNAEPDKQIKVITVAIHGKEPSTVCEYKIPSGVTKMTTARMKFAAGAMESFHLTTKFPFSGSPSKDIGNNPRLFVTK